MPYFPGSSEVLNLRIMDKDFLNFDISVAAAKKKESTSRKSFPGDVDNSQESCHMSGCKRKGKYRAPVSPNKLKEFHWFCKQHIKTYNTQWNFYEHQNQEVGIDANPGNTTSNNSFSWSNFEVNDAFEILGTEDRGNRTIRTVSRLRLSKTEQRASEILDLDGNFSKSDARSRYRVMVKDLHPDMNNGNRADEDRLKEVVWAWEQIKRSRKIPDL